MAATDLAAFRAVVNRNLTRSRGGWAPILLVAVLALFVPGAALAASTPRVGGPDTQPLQRTGRWLTDADGRVFVGHGVNVVKKVAPYVRTGFTEADARLLADEGFTVARIAFIWAGVEPKPGVYDDAYVDKILALDDLLARYGIRTVVDVHQDLWSEKTGGDGAPDWATLGSNFNDSFQAFWDDSAGPDGVGIQTHFVSMWRHLATKLASHGNVIGIDPFNEPYPGGGFPCSPFTPCPPFETGPLTDFYKHVIPAIREGGARQVIYPEAIADSGVIAPSLPGFDDPQTAFQYHFYCNATQTSSRATPVDEQTPEAAGCAPIEQSNLGNYHAYLEGLGVPGLLGEFSCNDVNDDNAQVVDITGAAFDSWTIWAYYTAADDPADCPGQGLVVDDSKPGSQENAKQDKLDALVVPHAQAIAGTPEENSYDRSTRTYSLSYGAGAVPGARLASGALTQVFVPARAYPKGYAVDVKGAQVVSAAGAPWLLLRTDPGAEKVEVTVSPREDSTTARPLSTGALPVKQTASCVQRKRLVVRLRDRRGRRLRHVRVKVNGKRVKLSRRARRTGRLVLKGRRLKHARIVVRLSGRTRTGRHVVVRHVYRGCVPPKA